MTETIARNLPNRWAGVKCVLCDSKTGYEYEAKITGRLQRFATVAAVDHAIQAEFSWVTVDRVMNENEGRFVI